MVQLQCMQAGHRKATPNLTHDIGVELYYTGEALKFDLASLALRCYHRKPWLAIQIFRRSLAEVIIHSMSLVRVASIIVSFPVVSFHS